MFESLKIWEARMGKLTISRGPIIWGLPENTLENGLDWMVAAIETDPSSSQRADSPIQKTLQIVSKANK